MSDNTEMIKPGTTIPQTNSVGVGINISEIVITSSGDWINKYPDCVAFGINEADTSIPTEGTFCMFCKTHPAIYSVKKMVSSKGQFAGWHYCAECKTRY